MLHPPPLPRTLTASLRDLSSAKAETRAGAIQDLARHASADEGARAQAVPLLENALRDEHAAVRAAAAVALADVRGVESLASLLTCVEDVDGYVRQMALNALGEIGDRRAAARVRRALKDERPEVRYQATIAFSRLADAADIAEALVAASRDEDGAIRYIALRIAEDRLPFGEEPLRERARAMLGDESAEVRLAAAIYLGNAGDHAGASLLLDVARGTFARRNEAEDEQEAIELCGALGLEEAVPHLERRAWGLRRLFQQGFVWAAKVALARLGHPRAVAEITADLASKDAERRRAAVVAAGRARLAPARDRLTALAASAGPEGELAKTALALLDQATPSPEGSEDEASP